MSCKLVALVRRYEVQFEENPETVFISEYAFALERTGV